MNENLIKRVAFGSFTIPTNNSDNTASTVSCSAGAYIPKGAIVTGIRYFAYGALTNVSNFKNATITPTIGAQSIGTNNVVASAVLVQTAAATQALYTAQGVYVSVGGPIVINLASSDSARTGIAGTADIYVEYLYCADRDIT